jgi:hypothetical protein
MLRVPKNLGFSFIHGDGEVSQEVACWSLTAPLPEEGLVSIHSTSGLAGGLLVFLPWLL